jgi:predicted nucleic acid-binding protein
VDARYAFDADVVIYAASAGHDLGSRVRTLIIEREARHPEGVAGIGSVLLLAEVLTKPVRDDRGDELVELAALLGRLELRPVDQATGELAVALGATYGLRPLDAVHLATAVAAGASHFVTNNRRDFPATIQEIEITYPDDLPSSASGVGQ